MIYLIIYIYIYTIHYIYIYIYYTLYIYNKIVPNYVVVILVLCIMYGI